MADTIRLADYFCEAGLCIALPTRAIRIIMKTLID